MSKSKDSQAPDAIFEYLQKQNRPYSAVDIYNNLHKEYGKTIVTRALENLAQEKKIIEKTYGKQKIYFIDQNTLPELSDVDLAKMDTEMTNLEGSIKVLEQTIKSNEALLVKLSGSMTTPAIKNKITQITQENIDLTSRLENLTKNASDFNPKERDDILKNSENFKNEWRKRKRMASNMLEAILEGYPKPKKTLYEEIGIETDEDLNVTLPK